MLPPPARPAAAAATCSPSLPPHKNTHTNTQPLEALRPGVRREFVVVEEEDEFGEVILSLAALEVRRVLDGFLGGPREATRRPP